jgi:exopolysaccharide biosynthesis polyprenyl glycosylphosphotransferase
VLLHLAIAAAWIGAPAAGQPTAGAASLWLLPVLTISLLALRGAYRDRLQVRVLDWVAQAAASTSLAAMCLIALDGVLTIGGLTPIGLFARAWLFATLYAAGGRILLGVVQRSAQAGRLVGKPTLIVGAGRIGARVERRLQTHPELGLLPIGYVDADPLPDELLPDRRAPVLGAPADLAALAEERGVEHVVFAFLSAPDDDLVPLVQECRARGIEMSLVPRLFDSIGSRVELEHMGGLPLYGLRATNPRGWQFAVKHTLGRLVGSLLLVVLAPVMLAIALGVKLSSPGPLLFRQLRIGRDGQQFELLKFRSMTVAPGAEATASDGRSLHGADDLGPGGVEHERQQLTRVGRLIRTTSMDELPQLWSVVRGDMTLVGPRPERPEFVELFGQSIRRYDQRHRVKSGITGWAQVHGLRGRTSLADRVEWDNYYIENWSLWLDCKILLMTLLAPFQRAE